MKDLYIKLKAAYSKNNLTKITTKLIELYKNKQFHTIRQYAENVNNYFPINIKSDSKCFTQLVALYHPDKEQYHINNMTSAFASNNHQELKKYKHIYELNNIEAVEIEEPPVDIDYEPEYIYDVSEYEGYSFVDEQTNEDVSFDNQRPINVIDAIKIKEYGHTDIDFPPYYLEDFEDYDLSDSNIEVLDGIEYCKHARFIDLSNNTIQDISLLFDLPQLEEVYLSFNNICLIDSLSNLIHLKALDLSFNPIDDFSPLFELSNIDYLNVLGCHIPQSQINFFKNKGITVIY